MASKYPTPPNAALSVVIPAYNAEAWIGPTLHHLAESLAGSNWKSIEVIIIDDGSKDNTAQAAEAAKTGLNIRVIKQKNAGRFLARKSGIDAARGDYIFFIDSRVFAHKKSFSYLAKQMTKDRAAVVWNGHVVIDRSHNPVARFWYAVTFMAWRRYMAHPRLVHYGLDELEYYPKGTTCFFVPRDLIVKAYDQFTTSFKDLHFANDDTALIRIVAAEHDLYMSPDFAFTYHYARSSFKGFIKHTLHRGTVFIDGFMHKGSRYFWPLILILLALPAAIALAILIPWLWLGIPGVMILAFALALALKVPVRDALALAYVLPVFTIFYSAGLYRGVYLKLSAR